MPRPRRGLPSADRFIDDTRGLITRLAEFDLVRTLDARRCDVLFAHFRSQFPQYTNLLLVRAAADPAPIEPAAARARRLCRRPGPTSSTRCRGHRGIAMLVRRDGTTVTCGIDAEPGRTKLASPFVELLDLLSVKGGIDLMRRIRSEARTRAVPIVVLGGEKEPRIVHDACRGGSAILSAPRPIPIS